MNTHLQITDILMAAKIGASRARLRDPAIGRDDAHQEVCLMLLEDESVDTTGLAIWKATKRTRDRIWPKHSRHRLKQSDWQDEFDFTDRRAETPLKILEREELRDIIETEPLTKAQRNIVDAMLNGNTPAEICVLFGMSLQSFSNLLAAAIKTLRRAVGSDATGSVRLGRCKAARDIAEHQREDPACEECGSVFTGKKAGAMFCSAKCRYKNGNRNRQ